jgi:hypothetical protein
MVIECGIIIGHRRKEAFTQDGKEHTRNDHRDQKWSSIASRTFSQYQGYGFGIGIVSIDC